MALELNSSKQPFVEINSPKYNLKFPFERNFENDSFEIYAIRDIEEGEQLTHKYKSLDWRECFQELKTDLKKTHNN